RTLVFTGNQIKPSELRIGHDLFPQRSSPGRDYLNNGLHSTAWVQQETVPFATLVSIVAVAFGRRVARRVKTSGPRFARRSGYRSDRYITYTSTYPLSG